MTPTTTERPPPIPPLPDVADVPRDSAVELAATAALILSDVQQWAPAAVAAVDFHGAAELRRSLSPITNMIYRRNLSKTATLDVQYASRIVERTLGQTLRAGQELGLVRTRGGRGNPAAHDVRDIIGTRSLIGIYRLAAVSGDEFETAIEAARATGSLAIEVLLGVLGDDVSLNESQRAQRDRIAQLAAEGRTTKQIAEAIGVKPNRVSALARRYGIPIPADAATRRMRRINPTRIITEAIPTLDGLGVAAQLLAADDYAALDPIQAKEWARQLSDALTPIMHMQRALDARGKES
jgi:hypothetical protein